MQLEQKLNWRIKMRNEKMRCQIDSIWQFWMLWTMVEELFWSYSVRLDRKRVEGTRQVKREKLSRGKEKIENEWDGLKRAIARVVYNTH